MLPFRNVVFSLLFEYLNSQVIPSHFFLKTQGTRWGAEVVGGEGVRRPAWEASAAPLASRRGSPAHGRLSSICSLVSDRVVFSVRSYKGKDNSGSKCCVLAEETCPRDTAGTGGQAPQGTGAGSSASFAGQNGNLVVWASGQQLLENQGRWL